jgi:hypothetical protein
MARKRVHYKTFAYDDETGALLYKIHCIAHNALVEDGDLSSALMNVMHKVRVLSRLRQSNDYVLFTSEETDSESDSYVSQSGKLSEPRSPSKKRRDRKRKAAQLQKAREQSLFNDYDFVPEYQMTYEYIVASEQEQTYMDSQSGSLPAGQDANPDIQTSEQEDQGAITTGFNTDVPGNMFASKTATDPLRMDGYVENFDLSTFLQRPLQIYSVDWNVADFLRETFRPWTLYLSHPAIVRKLDNYLYIRGTLKITLMLNGTQYHYGKGILSYNPLISGNQPLRTPGSAPVIDNVTYSQRPHILFDPSDSVGGEMELPFVYDQTWLELTDGFKVDDMGELTLSSFGRLGMASGETDSVRITVFAHFKPDVVLSGSTTQLVSQSGKKDEYGDGIISKPATSIARWAGYLTTVPEIAPFALATQMGANAIGGIAKLFGYSRPVNVEPVRKYRPTFVGNIANSSIEEAVDKLSFDPKQETTIDPRITGYGSGGDDLTINSIASRYSYLTSTAWSTSESQGTHLASLRVSPALFGKQTIAAEEQMVMTPMCFAAQPFKYWRGSIKVRVQVVCSKFHKGRLRLVYDPKGLTNATLDWIGGYHEVMDISEKTDMEFTINWNQPVAYREVQNVVTGDTLAAENHTPIDGLVQTAEPITNSEKFSNGIFAIFVQNELVRPDTGDTYTPRINIFVSAGDDFEVATPDTVGMQTISYLSSQSGAITDAQPSDSAPLGHDIDSKDVGGRMQDMPGNSVVYFGETFHTFRDMLKRYCLSETILSPDTSSIGRQSSFWLWRVYHKVFPRYRGGGNTIETFSYARLTLMNYLTPAFVARRGGLRWKYVYTSCNGPSFIPAGRFQMSRYEGAPTADDNACFPMGSTGQGGNEDLQIDLVTTFAEDTWGGGYTTSLTVNPTVEVEYPYYSNLRFKRASNLSYTTGDASAARGTLLVPGNGNSDPIAGSHALDIFVAAGEDFNLVWFLSCPYVYAQKFPRQTF